MMVAMLASHSTALFAALERRQVLILAVRLVAAVVVRVGWDVTVCLSIELVTRLAILSVDVQ